MEPSLIIAYLLFGLNILVIAISSIFVILSIELYIEQKLGHYYLREWYNNPNYSYLRMISLRLNALTILRWWATSVIVVVIMNNIVDFQYDCFAELLWWRIFSPYQGIVIGIQCFHRYNTFTYYKVKISGKLMNSEISTNAPLVTADTDPLEEGTNSEEPGYPRELTYQTPSMSRLRWFLYPSIEDRAKIEYPLRLYFTLHFLFIIFPLISILGSFNEPQGACNSFLTGISGWLSGIISLVMFGYFIYKLRDTYDSYLFKIEFYGQSIISVVIGLVGFAITSFSPYLGNMAQLVAILILNSFSFIVPIIFTVINYLKRRRISYYARLANSLHKASSVDLYFHNDPNILEFLKRPDFEEPLRAYLISICDVELYYMRLFRLWFTLRDYREKGTLNSDICDGAAMILFNQYLKRDISDIDPKNEEEITRAQYIIEKSRLAYEANEYVHIPDETYYPIAKIIEGIYNDKEYNDINMFDILRIYIEDVLKINVFNGFFKSSIKTNFDKHKTLGMLDIEKV